MRIFFFPTGCGCVCCRRCTCTPGSAAKHGFHAALVLFRNHRLVYLLKGNASRIPHPPPTFRLSLPIFTVARRTREGEVKAPCGQQLF